MCYFVKCANKKAYLNACGPATRNDMKGDGFCSHLDPEGFCGPSLHDYHAKKKDEKKKGDYKKGFTSYTESSYDSGKTYPRYQG